MPEGASLRKAVFVNCFFFSSRRRHTRLQGDWSSDVCSSDLRASNKQLEALAPKDAAGLKAFQAVIGPALRAMVTDTLPDAADLQPRSKLGQEKKIGRASCRERV